MSPVGVVAVAVLGYAAFALPALGWRTTRWLALGLLAGGLLWLVAGAQQAPIGLKASYWAATQPQGSPERSTDFPWLTDATRIEPRLELRGEDFGVHFFNDAARFNFGPDVQPGRDQLPFSLRLEGWLVADSDGERRFVLESNGPARAFVDDAPLPQNDATLRLSPGLHAVRVEYSRPEAQVPWLRLRWQPTPGSALQVLEGDAVRWAPDARSTTLGIVLGWAAAAILAGVIAAWLTLGFLQLRRKGAVAWWRAALGLAPLLFLAYGMLLEAPAAGRATILSGLDDWLIYESSARDILLNGLLMDGGQGHAAPFYGQPLYPYVLAVAHRITGESLFGPIALQFAGLGLVVVGTAVLARTVFGAVLDGIVAAAGFLVLLQLEPEHFKIARQLFNENLYMPLVMASLIVLVGLARRRAAPRWWLALLAGLLLGITAISRSQFLLCIPFGLLVVWLAWRRAGWRTALAKTLLVGAGLVLAILPVTTRNVVVSGQFVPISSSGGASLLEFHRPPPGLIDQSALEHDPLYDALHLDQQTRTVLAFVRADPRGYVATLLPLGAHSIGLQGRNDPGIYWPLLLTFLLYISSFALRRTRALHVWPIHAFVGTHLLVLMLFEADTYGYRLVMPMYAPMVALAAQVPLQVVRGLLRSPAGASLRSGEPSRAGRFAVAGWSVIILAALVWQARGLIELWPDREPALHGLGGAAAHAAATSDRIGANAIYVASVDGTPRHFGAGSLPGLRYPWFKWFDPVRSLPFPSAQTTAVYVLSELVGHSPSGDITPCLGTPDATGEVVVDQADVGMRCGAGLGDTNVTFDGVARFEAADVPATGVAGENLETRLLWQPLVAHPAQGYQVSLQLDDPRSADGIQWGNGTLNLYPPAEWDPNERILSRIPVVTDGTAIPQAYRLTLGVTPDKANAQPAMARLDGAQTDRVPIARVVLTPGTGDVAAQMPSDMRPVEGAPLIGGGLELVGMRALPAEAAVGSPVRVGLLWKAVQDEPTATQVTLKLVRASGEVVQQTQQPLLGGRATPSSLRAGNVVRDEQDLLIDPRVPNESMSLEVAVNDASVRLGSLKLTGRSHVLDASGASALATFGGVMDQMASEVSPASARGGDKVTVKLRWRSAAAMSQAYKVFVHVLDPAGQQVVAQRDAEPQDGKAPTTGWVVGEVIDDSYDIALPSGLAAGEYPLEIGVYDPKSGDRLRLASGDNRLLLATRLRVTR